MRILALSVLVLTLVSGCSGTGVDEPTAGSNHAQQAHRQVQVAAEQPTIPQQPFAPEQQAAAEKLGRPVSETNSIGMQLVLIPAGEFLMGSPATQEGRGSDEQQHPVRITKSFHLSVHEVTQEQYERVTGVNPSFIAVPQHPVDNVSWNNAVRFCSQLSALPEEKAAGRVYRLPTEAEWEYACRAGSTTSWNCGNEEIRLGDFAWFGNSSRGRVHPVRAKKPNAWGLCDMHGNVWEWCADWYEKDYYASSPVDDPPGPTAGTLRVVRGGGWGSTASDCRAAFRSTGLPIIRDNRLGFRVAAAPARQ